MADAVLAHVSKPDKPQETLSICPGLFNLKINFNVSVNTFLDRINNWYRYGPIKAKTSLSLYFLGIFIANPSFLALFVLEMHFYHCHSRQCCLNSWGHAKGEAVLGMRKEVTNPSRGTRRQAGWFRRLRRYRLHLGHGAGERPQARGARVHCKPEPWVARGVHPTVRNSHAKLYKFLLFLRFSGGKAVCAPHLCLGQGTYTGRGRKSH